MQHNYKLIINNKKYEGYKKIASFLFLINAAIFIAFAIKSTSISTRLILFTASFILLIYAVYNWYYKKKKEKSYIIVYLLLAVIWISDTAFWWFAFVFPVMLAFQFRMEKDFIIYLSFNKICVSGFVSKIYRWSDFNNIILKDGLLTLDFSNNKILQVEPDWNESIAISGIMPWEPGEGYPESEKEFNEFCREQLRSAASPV